MHLRPLFALLLGSLACLARGPQPARAAGRPNILWLVAEDFGPELGCYGTGQVCDPEPRPAGGRGGPLHPGVHHGAGLLGEPVGVHDRDVPDDHRRPQPPLAPRRRLPAPRRVSG